MESSVSKTKLVKRILDEIGAIGDNPPYKWKKMVDEKLRQHGVDPRKVTSYAVRQRAIRDMCNIDRSALRMVTKEKQVTDHFPTVDEIEMMLQPLMELKNLIKKFGGKDNLLHYLDLVEKLSV